MKQILLSSLSIFLISSSLQAQIAIGTEIFPEIGDVLTTATDVQAEVEIQSAGEDLVWDWSSLEADTENEQNFQAATLGGFEVSNADMVVVGEFGGEVYYQTADNAVNIVALFGEAPIDLGTNLLSTFNPPVAEYRTINFEDEFNTETTLTFPSFSSDIVPAGILDSLDLPGGITPDSLRFGVMTTRTSTIDSWGEMTIPSGTYQVLRERRVEEREVTVGFKVGIFPWVDFPIPAEFGVDLGNTTYVYWSNTSKEPIALVTTTGEEEEVQTVEYKNNDNMVEPNAISDLNYPNSTIYAYPNPTYGAVNFMVENVETGIYSMNIYNVLGKQVWQNNYFISGNSTIHADVHHLQRGAYLYNLVDTNGRIIATQRLLVARP